MVQVWLTSDAALPLPGVLAVQTPPGDMGAISYARPSPHLSGERPPENRFSSPPPTRLRWKRDLGFRALRRSPNQTLPRSGPTQE